MVWFLFVVAVWALVSPTAQAADRPEVKLNDKPQDVSLTKLGEKFRLIGKLGRPLGEVVTVQGFVVDGPIKGYEDGPNLRVQRINGRATQEDIQILLRPYFGKFGEKVSRDVDLPKLDSGEAFEFEGYETGGFVGVPTEAYKKADTGTPLQTTRHYFRHVLVVYKGKTIEPIVWAPADFVDRVALIEGKAVSRDKKAYIEGKAWRLLTDAVGAWPTDVEGKAVEGFGTMRKVYANEYRLEKGATRLVKLDDQRGRTVELRGTARSLNGHWWFVYRGRKLYVERMNELPGWNDTLHNRPVIITGVLEEDDLPDIDQISVKPVPDKKKYFVVRKAEWKPLDALLAPERVDRQ